MGKKHLTIDTDVNRIVIIKDGVIYSGSMTQREEKPSACEYAKKCRMCDLSMTCYHVIPNRVLHATRTADRDEQIAKEYEKKRYNGD